MGIGIEDHLASLRADGERMVLAAQAAGLDAPVPPTPGWTVRDLLTHTGCVHRWATAYVRDGRREPRAIDGDGTLVVPDDEILDWFREGHGALLDTLASADPSVHCWTLWRDTSSPREFWARRQAHETLVHRVDAELALAAVEGRGEKPEAAASLAADGVDELLMGFYALRHRGLVSPEQVTLCVRCDDTDTAWTIRIGPGARVVTRTADDANCVVSGSASDVYLFLWNRVGTERLRVDGDAAVLTLWRERARIV